jgi:hypothetical protein
MMGKTPSREESVRGQRLESVLYFILTVSCIDPILGREVVGESNLHLRHEGVVLFFGARDPESAEASRKDLNEERRHESGKKGLYVNYLYQGL